MTKETTGWFHCGRCGRLFQAPTGQGERVCSHCGRDPSMFGESLAKLHQPAPVPGRRSEPNEEMQLKRRAVRKRKKRMLLTKIIVCWLVFLVGIVGLVKLIGGAQAPPAHGRGNTGSVGAMADETTSILQKATPAILQNFERFINAGTPEERNQYVNDPVGTVAKMARFQLTNPSTILSSPSVTLQDRQIIRIQNRQVIGTTWRLGDDRRVDAVFFEKDGDWKLDWDQFIRYNDTPWPLFLAGSGPDAGEFRLLARQRRGSGEGDGHQLSISFYAPRLGHPDDPGVPSPEILVPRASEAGQLLTAAFEEAKQGRHPLEGDLAKFDPEGMIRVRIRMRRTQEGNERKFTVEKLVACHWINVEETGIATVPPPAQAPAGAE